MNWIKRLSKPLFEELPFFIFFMLLMGVNEAIWKIWYLAQGITLSGQLSLMSQVSSIAVWATFGYLLCLLLSQIKKTWLKVVLYAILVIMWATQNYLRIEFGSPISPTYLTLLAETTPEESKEFIHEFLFSASASHTLKKAGLCIILIIITEILYSRLKKRVSFPGILQTVIGFLLVPVVLWGVYSCRMYLQLLFAKSVDNDVLLELPRDPFSCTYSSFVMLSRTSENTQQCIDITLSTPKASISKKSVSDSLNVILVVGESYNKYHSQLYGYTLETTPFLQEEYDNHRLFLFQDVTAPSNMTSAVLKNVLCTNSLGDGEQWYESPYVPYIFKNAGYDVYLWDNQKQDIPLGAVEFSVHSLLYNDRISSASYSDCNSGPFQYDSELVDDFIQSAGTFTSSYNFIIFHLMGQHFSAKSRYPESDSVFSMDDIEIKQPFYNDVIRRQIAEYDNATAYNDRVLQQIISFFSTSNSILIYFSDHADEVYDYRDQLSRDQGSLTPAKLKYQYDIPFMIWCSDIYIDKNPDIVSCISNSVDKPFMTDNLCHLLFHISKIETSIYNNERDLIDSTYVCPPRVLYEQSVDYDSLRWECEE